MKKNKEHLRILVVDDEIEYLEAMEIILEDAGYSIDRASSGEEALEKLKVGEYDLVLSDLIMGGIDGLQLLESVKDKYPETEVIITTGFGSVKNAVEAIKKGAYTYFIKGHDPDELVMEIGKFATLKSLKKENEILRDQQKNKKFVLETKSPKFKQALEMAKRAAVSNANILILGESGVGKEVFAHYIHQCSDRSEELFIGVNCHAFSDSLLESELFGHEKGAFTGAHERRKGRFEAAENGTILLDEIGDISLSTQVKLLRVIEGKTIERIGSNTSMAVDFRLLCATNKDLQKAIEQGGFREDLFYRISTITIEIPPLRERKEDLPDLIDFFIAKSSNDLKRDISGMDPEVMAHLLSYDYPGNVRELKNMVERLVVLAEDGVIKKMDIQSSNEIAPAIEDPEDIRPLKDLRKELESKYIQMALDKCQNNMTLTSKKLGISRRQLFNKIQEYGLNK